MQTTKTVPRSNPFCTRFVGSLPYIDQHGTLEQAMGKWRNANWIGQIVGAHGVGKSTMASAMTNAAVNQRNFDSVIKLVFRPGSNRTAIPTGKLLPGNPSVCQTASDPVSCQPASDRLPRRLLIVDGLERLNRFHRWALVRYCRPAKFGLLVTAHRPLSGLTTIANVASSRPVLHRIVTRLLRDHNDNRLLDCVDTRKIDLAYDRAQGNLREALMLLYDEVETGLGSGLTQM